MSNRKEVLYNEIELRSNIGVEGVRFDPKIFKSVLEKDANIAASHNCMDFSLDDTANVEIPGGFRLDHGIGVQLNKNYRSPYYLEEEDGTIYLKNDGAILSKIEVTKASPIYGKNTSDGTSMKTIVAAGDGQYGDKQILVAYSNECALKDKGLDCLFCNINATKDRFAEKVIGSKLEGHRTPTPEWHWDVQQKIYRILRKYGRTFEQVYNATPGAILLHDFYKVEDGLLFNKNV